MEELLEETVKKTEKPKNEETSKEEGLNEELLKFLNNNRHLKKLNNLYKNNSEFTTDELCKIIRLAGKSIGYSYQFAEKTKKDIEKNEKYLRGIIKQQSKYYGKLQDIIKLTYSDIIALMGLLLIRMIVNSEKEKDFVSTFKHYIKNNYSKIVYDVFETIHTIGASTNMHSGFDTVFTIDPNVFLSDFLTMFLGVSVEYRPCNYNVFNYKKEHIVQSMYLYDRVVNETSTFYSSMYVDFSTDYTYEMAMINLTILTGKQLIILREGAKTLRSENLSHFLRNDKLCFVIHSNHIIHDVDALDVMKLLSGVKVCIARIGSRGKFIGIPNQLNIFPYISMELVGEKGYKIFNKSFMNKDLMFSFLELLKNRLGSVFLSWYFKSFENYNKEFIPYSIDQIIRDDCFLIKNEMPENMLIPNHWKRLKPIIFNKWLEIYMGMLFHSINSFTDVKVLIGAIFSYNIFKHYEDLIDGKGEIEINGEFCVSTIEKIIERLCDNFLIDRNDEWITGILKKDTLNLERKKVMSISNRVKYNSGYSDKVTIDYDFKLINFNLDYKFFLSKLKKGHTGRFLLHGPSGSGKSEFAKKIAKELGKEVTFIRVSDFRKQYVGEGEEEILRLFEQAEEKGNVVIVDECDSLFTEREGSREYVKDMVNHMLTILDEHDGIVFFTSNFSESLDKAFLRRLTLKIKFDYLTEESKMKLLMEVMFKLGKKVSKSEIEKHEIRLKKLKLTSGMFKSTLDKFTFYKEATLEEVIKTLEEDNDMISNSNGGKQMGFL